MSVNPDQDQHRRNRLLAALRPRDYALLEPHLQIVPIGEGEFLHLPGDEIEQVYFLHKGIVSLMAISKEGNAIATASVGSEGAIGTIVGTGFVRAFTRELVHAPGVASRIEASHFRRAVFAVEPADVSLLHILFYAASAGGWDDLLDTEGGAQQDRIVMRGAATLLAAVFGIAAMVLHDPQGR